MDTRLTRYPVDRWPIVRVYQPQNAGSVQKARSSRVVLVAGIKPGLARPASFGWRVSFCATTTLTTPAPSRNVARPEANRLEEIEMETKHTLEDRLDGIRFEAWARNAVAFIRSKELETEFSDWCGGFPVPVAGTSDLIASAPKLLDALKALESVAKYGGTAPFIQGELEDARAAIARATGADQ